MKRKKVSLKEIQKAIKYMKKHAIKPDKDGNYHYLPGTGWVKPNEAE